MIPSTSVLFYLFFFKKMEKKCHLHTILCNVFDSSKKCRSDRKKVVIYLIINFGTFIELLNQYFNSIIEKATSCFENNSSKFHWRNIYERISFSKDKIEQMLTFFRQIRLEIWWIWMFVQKTCKYTPPCMWLSISYFVKKVPHF